MLIGGWVQKVNGILVVGWSVVMANLPYKVGICSSQTCYYAFCMSQIVNTSE